MKKRETLQLQTLVDHPFLIWQVSIVSPPGHHVFLKRGAAQAIDSVRSLRSRVAKSATRTSINSVSLLQAVAISSDVEGVTEGRHMGARGERVIFIKMV